MYQKKIENLFSYNYIAEIILRVSTGHFLGTVVAFSLEKGVSYLIATFCLVLSSFMTRSF